MSRTQTLSTADHLVTDRFSSTRLQRALSPEPPAINDGSTQSGVGNVEPSKPAVAKTLWDEFSDQDKADSVGKLWGKKLKSRYRWDVQGRLRDEIWIEKTLPVLSKLENENYSDIYGAGNKHVMRALHVSLLSPIEDSCAAYPAILIMIDVRKIGQKMKQIFENHQHFQKLNTGLRIEVISGSQRLFRFPAAEDISSTDGPSRGLYDSLCGTGVLVTGLPPTEDSHWKRATVGGVVRNPQTGEYFAVTVAHCFRVEVGPVNASDDESDDSICSSQQSDATDSSLRKIRREEPDDISEPTSYAQRLPNEIYGAYIDAEDDRSSRKKNNRELHPSSLAYMGDIDLRINHSDHAMTSGSSPQYCLDLDWALIRVRDARFMQKNRFPTPWNVEMCPNSILFNNEQPEPGAILAAHVSGIRKVNFSSTESSVRFPWATTACRVWTLEAGLAQGDSGSWVFSTDGSTVYGMVVASIPTLSMVYVVRVEDLFQSIRSTWLNRVALHDMLPTNELKELDIISARCSTTRIQSTQPLETEQAYSLRSTAKSLLLDRHMNSHSATDPEMYYPRSPRYRHDLRSPIDTSPFTRVQQLQRQLLDESRIQQLRSRLPEEVVRFTEILRGDYEYCRKFVAITPEVLKFDPEVLMVEALKAYHKRYLVLTHACIERAVMIQDLQLSNAPNRVRDFLQDLQYDGLMAAAQVGPQVDAILRALQSKYDATDQSNDAEVRSLRNDDLRTSSINSQPFLHDPRVTEFLLSTLQTPWESRVRAARQPQSKTMSGDLHSSNTTPPDKSSKFIRPGVNSDP